MSHFSVAVLTYDEPTYDDLVGLLAPYSEDDEYYATEFVEDPDCDFDYAEGKRGYWVNPDAKWDWWTEGGRWSDLLHVESGAVSRAKVSEIENEFTTWAVLTLQGEWVEPGRVIWFGASTASEEDEREWESSYKERFLTEADLFVTIVDCHI